jgi:tRNA threonylcarbamoyladenosine biosynthesis protein TsaB
MIALALDTSGPIGSVAVVRGDEGTLSVLAKRTIGQGMRHGVELFPAIEAALKEAGRTAREIDLVAVGTGPGSYTGLRVGLTAARALAYASGAELIGVPSCDALAEAIPIRIPLLGAAADGEAEAAKTDGSGETLAVVIDARVRAVYVALYQAAPGGWERVGAPEILPPAEAAGRIPSNALVVGDGPAAHADSFATFRRAEEPHSVGAPSIARLALALRARGEVQMIDAVTPLYLRKTEAERKLARGEL